MTPPHFRIGNKVHVTGPAKNDLFREQPDFEIDHIRRDCDGDLLYSGYMVPWYPASSLRLVEDLQVGDLVEIIGQPDGYSQTWGNEGKIDRIREVESEGRFWLDKTCLLYKTKSLRKLTPDEIAKHLAPPANTPQNQWIEEADKRLSAIENRQDEARKYSDDLESITETLGERIYKIDKRLSRLEGDRPETGKFKPNTTFIITNSYDPDYVKWVLDSMKET